MVLEKQLWDYDNEILTAENERDHVYNPATKHSLYHKIAELKRRANADVVAIGQLTTEINQFQNRIMDRIERIAKITRKHLVLVPSMKSRVHTRPESHPMSKPGEGKLVITQDVYIEEYVSTSTTIISEVRHAEASIRETDIKEYVSKEIAQIETTEKEIETIVATTITLMQEDMELTRMLRLSKPRSSMPKITMRRLSCKSSSAKYTRLNARKR